MNPRIPALAVKKEAIILAAVAGFLVPVGCGLMEMALFTGKDSGLAHFLAYQLPYIICPVWALGDGSAFWIVAIPLLNAFTYALVAFLWLKAKNAMPEHRPQ